ncbi:hypothetical protein GUJ93_ZPchr0010g11043 [Zizania palustris]|uniref:Uncharacterized protein n=1 Tax=Zizania palustris TaxID=103762 RepID=A0A8J5W894_ZIZPA|nr:hypothetical protein GUJ93_ZPchr0010g11043 [Zizania palustris]
MNGNGESEMNTNGGSDANVSLDNQCPTSSASKAKRAKSSVTEEEGLIGAINRVGEKLACAIEKVATQPPPPPLNDDLPEDLFEMLSSLPGYESTQISVYYAYLVANPRMGRAFYKLPFEHKLNWVAMFIADKFPGH